MPNEDAQKHAHIFHLVLIVIVHSRDLRTDTCVLLVYKSMNYLPNIRNGMVAIKTEAKASLSTCGAQICKTIEIIIFPFMILF